MKRSRLVGIILIALLFGAVVSVFQGVSFCWRRGEPHEIGLNLDKARCSQCRIDGNVLTSIGTDSQLTWIFGGKDGVWAGALDVQVESSEVSVLEVFHVVAGDKKPINPTTRLVQPLQKGKNHVIIPIGRRVSLIRMDFGTSKGQRFNIQAITLRNQIIVPVVKSAQRCLLATWSIQQFLLRGAIVFGVVFFMLLHLIVPVRRIWKFIDARRYWLALAIFLFAVLFAINGSSIGCWNEYVPNVQAEGSLFGRPRRIRSDEFATFTSLTLAQSHCDYPYFNNLPRGVPTDMFVIHPQPVKNPLVIFRPFLAGYLFLGFSRGLSFFWVTRWLILLLVMYEFFKLLTMGEKTLSGIGAFMVALSPVVQWWGAVNALAEMFIFGGLFIVCLNRCLTGRTLRNRWLPIIGMAYSVVCYAMTLYPAAQIPLSYVFAAIAVGIIFERLERCRDFCLDRRSVAFAVLMTCVAIGCLACYAWLSRNAFHITANTVYPGARMGKGGDCAKWFGISWGSLFLPWHPPTPLNEFRAASFLDMFPLGFYLASVLFIRKRMFDILIALLVVVSAFLGVYCSIGFPEWLARLTLMGRTVGWRAYIVIGFAQIIILIRAVSLLKVDLSVWGAMVMAFKFSLLNALLARFAYGEYISCGRGLVIFLVAMGGHFLLLRFHSHCILSAVYFGFLMLVVGASVNPIQQGDAGVLNSDLAQRVKEIAMRNPCSLWMVEDGFPIVQYPMMMGAPTINAINSYPIVDRWRLIDPDENNAHIWNRHAQYIPMRIKKGGDVEFKLLGSAYFSVQVANRDVVRLGVRYVLSRRDLSALSDDAVSYRCICRVSDFGVFEVQEMIKPKPDYYRIRIN